MILRRILYGLTLMGVLLFHITNENYLAQFLLALCIALPLLSLALSLPGMLGCRMELSAVPSALGRGSEGRWLVSIEAPSCLPLPRLVVHLTGKNLLTGQRDHRRLVLSGVARWRPVELTAATAHCGLMELRVDRARVYDYLGLFSLSAARPGPARMLCRPLPVQVKLPAIPEGQGARPSSASAARLGLGEDYELRGYRPGDPMRAVHWKLSSKWDTLIVREREAAMSPLVLLTLDRFGTPETLDSLLDRTLGMSRALLNIQRPHGVLWLDRNGQTQLCVVSDEKELNDCLLALLGTFAPPEGPALDDHPELFQGPNGPVFRVRITPEGGDSRD